MKKVTAIYFSPTGNTEKSVRTMAEAAACPVRLVDLTVEQEAPDLQFGRDELVILGMPVYAGRLPAAAKGRFDRLRGEETPCIAVVTYGNRDYDDALLELADMARARGFRLLGAAALVGRHTYGEIQVDRPSCRDLEADREFIRKALAKPEDAPIPAIPGNRPYRKGGDGGRFRPRTSEDCTGCGLCVRQCPVRAIADDCVTVGESCISCFRCVRKCPAGAKGVNTEEYRAFAEDFSRKLKTPKENRYFL